MSAEAYGLTADQQYEAMDLACILPVHGDRRQHKEWSELSDEQRKACAAAWLSAHRPDDAPGKRSGVSQKQLDYIAKAVHDAIVDSINPQLEPLIRSHVFKLFSDNDIEVCDQEINRIAHRVMGQIPEVRELNLLKGELWAMKKAFDKVRDDLLPLVGKSVGTPPVDAETLQSFERRLSRHADHLSGLESRLKRLERGE